MNAAEIHAGQQPEKQQIWCELEAHWENHYYGDFEALKKCTYRTCKSGFPIKMCEQNG